MANHSKFIKLLLSFVIAISPIILINNANAASVGGVAQGASTVYNGTKQVIIDGKDYIKKGTAIITPTATGVAKVLAKGVAAVALSVAVEQLIGAVDWVLDPANNQIVYYKLPSQSEPNLPTFRESILLHANGQSYHFQTKEQACHYYQRFLPTSYTYTVKISGMTCINEYKLYGQTQQFTISLGIAINPNYDPEAKDENEKKTLPLETVAQKVISNAESGDTNAQVATTAAAADIVAEAETDNAKARPIAQQLEASSTTKPVDEAAAAESNTATATATATGTQTQNPTKPEATDLKLEFPAFCGWAPIVCEAAQKVISFPITLTGWWETANTKAEAWATSISEAWTSAKEWATSEPSQENTQVDVENNNTQEIDTQVSFSTQCPSPINLANFSYHGISQSWTVDFSKFCDVFATYLKPVVISIGAFSAVLIVSGVGVRENG